MGGSWGDFGGSEGGQRGVGEATRRTIFFVHLVRFKIMGLCGGFSLLLKRPEMMLNEFFDDLFLESPFFLFFFRELYIRKFRDFFPMIFTTTNSILR